MALDLKIFRVRSLSATVFVIVLLGCVWFSYASCLALFFFVALWALHEFYSLAEKMGYKPFRVLGIFCGIITFACVYAFHLPAWVLEVELSNGILCLVPFIIAVQFLFTKNENPFHDMVFTIAGIFYCIIPFALLVQIPIEIKPTILDGTGSYNAFRILGIIFLIWANDTFAYIGGSMYGKHKMYERVSPGKTWEGTITGIVFCVVVGFVLNLNHTFSSQWLWPLIALVVGVFGTIGDLIESLMKRKAGVKDSGALMPGHGGVLDRFDSLLFVSPFVFVILKLAEGTL